MQENDCLEFALMFLRKEFGEWEVNYWGEFEFREEKIQVLFSKKLEKFLLLLNLEKFSKISIFQEIFDCFQSKNDIKSLIFCLITFKNKFILYDFSSKETIDWCFAV